MKLALSTALIAAVLNTCHGDETVRAYGGEGQIWVLSELDGAPYTAHATLSFPQTGRITGDAPCNSYAASMTVPYPWFKAGPMSATKQSCPEFDAEATFFKALTAATLSEIVGNTLILSNPDGLTMVFKAAD